MRRDNLSQVLFKEIRSQRKRALRAEAGHVANQMTDAQRHVIAAKKALKDAKKHEQALQKALNKFRKSGNLRHLEVFGVSADNHNNDIPF